jgi:hypothetical protein
VLLAAGFGTRLAAQEAEGSQSGRLELEQAHSVPYDSRVDVAAAAVIPVARATRAYFGTGAKIEGAYNLLIPIDGGQVQVGAGVAAAYLPAEGAVRRAHGFFVPLFAEAGATFLPTAPVRPGLNLQFGGTIVHLSSNFAPGYTTVLPFASASIDVRFELGAAVLTASVAGEYHAEEELPIWLLSPGVGVEIPLD